MKDHHTIQVPNDFYSRSKFDRAGIQSLMTGEMWMREIDNNPNAVAEAIRFSSEALALRPDDCGAMWLRAQIAIKQSDHGLAVLILSALAERVKTAEVYNNLGSCYVSMQMTKEGEEWFRKAVKIDPKCRPALNNIALCKVHNCEWAAAEHYAAKALAVAAELRAAGKEKPGEDIEWDTRETLGYAQLAQKNYVEGWKNYNRMVGRSKSRPWKPLGDEPRLTLEEHLKVKGTGKQLYIRGEQGIGDELHFSSILEQAAKDYHILYDVSSELYGLIKRSFPYVRVFPFRKNHDNRDFGPDYKPDYHCLIGDLAQMYRTCDADFPSTSFLVACPELREMWRARLAMHPGRKVGFTFTGGIRRTYKKRRTVELTAMAPLFNIPGITWVCLGWEPDTADELAHFTKNRDMGRILHFGDTMEMGQKNYDHIAALTAELDMVITVPQASVHLAGGLGKEVIVLRPETARWFYYQNKPDNPSYNIWYPNVRMLDQKKGTWPIRDVAKLLEGTDNA